MDDTRALDTGRLAVAIGLVAAGSAVCITTYLVAGGPFGTINDVGNATTGVLSAALAWRLRGASSGRTDDVGTVLALGGGALTVAGSALVISGATGFMLAGAVSSVGFAGIGAWLIALNRGRRGLAWSGRTRAIGVAAGALMAVGIALVPAIALRIDDLDTAPGWVWIGFIGWLGIYIVYPLWAFRVGLLETRRARQPEASSWTAG